MQEVGSIIGKVFLYIKHTLKSVKMYFDTSFENFLSLFCLQKGETVKKMREEVSLDTQKQLYGVLIARLLTLILFTTTTFPPTERSQDQYF